MGKPLFVAVLTLAIAFQIATAGAQQGIETPRVKPTLIALQDEDGEDKPRKDAGEPNQNRPAQTIDEPSLRPLMFGRSSRERYEGDPTATTITLGEEDENIGFFGAFNFLVPEETNLSIGIGPVYRPDYFGSDDYEFNYDPQAYIKVRNFVFVDDDGADFALFGFSGFRVGPSLRVRAKRKESSNPALQGLGDVGATVEFGGFAATSFLDRFAFKAKVRHGLKTGHRGTIVDGYLTALLFRAGPVSLAASGQASWVGNRFADAYFSVTPEQSAASGGRLGVYDVDAGFRDFGGTVVAYINIGDRWSFNPYATYNFIMDDVAKTPIIAEFGDRHQFRFGFHLMREFRFQK